MQYTIFNSFEAGIIVNEISSFKWQENDTKALMMYGDNHNDRKFICRYVGTFCDIPYMYTALQS